MSAVDLERLGAFLAAAGICDARVRARRIGDGHSNLTYLVEDGERRVVVRRPPPPPLPRGGHDMLREARIVRALGATRVPVPRVLATGEAGTAFADVPCYVMDYIEGSVATDSTPPTLATPHRRRMIAQGLVDTLVALHEIDHRAVGLGSLGRPEGSNARLLGRYRALVADDAGTLPDAFRELDDWLAERVPAETATGIVHGDFRIGNVMLDPAIPRIVAVLDWELATIGDPLMDVGYFLACYAAAGEASHPVSELGLATLEDGYPLRGELAERYAAASGRDVSGLAWYTALNLFKLAAMYEYKRRRADDPYYRDPLLVQRFLGAAHEIAKAPVPAAADR